MAGSYQHLLDEQGNFTMDLIENLRDAREALEECFAMIQWLSGGDKMMIHLANREGYWRANTSPENMEMITYEKMWKEPPPPGDVVPAGPLEAMVPRAYATTVPGRRRAAYAAINDERAFQDRKWGPLNGHPHEVGGWLTLIRVYLQKAEAAWAGNTGDVLALVQLRKLLAIGVACGEQHGLPVRECQNPKIGT